MSMSDQYTSLWWPEDRIDATVTTEYILSHLHGPDSHARLYTLPNWGEDLTSETYLDWILSKGKRLFLILNDIGIPDRIFALVDQSYDDSDLPIAASDVDLLQLAPDESGHNDPNVDDQFFHAQWRFLVRGIAAGEHVVFDSQNEGVPVEVHRNGMALGANRDDEVEKVILAGAICRTYIRTKVQVGEAPHFFEADEVLDEVRSLRRLAHEHVFSVHASYFVDNSIYILFAHPHERHLMSFLTDVPQQFKKLPKPHRRRILVNWPHCLANGLAWLHAHGQGHGAIRPSNVLIDSEFRVFLGQFEALDTLLPPPKVNDIEAYQYGAPERWVLSTTVQETGSSRTVLPSGGRTMRRDKPASLSTPLKLNTLASAFIRPGNNKHNNDSFETNSHNPDIRESMLVSSPTSRPGSPASQTTAIRVGFSDSASRASFALSSSSSSSGGSNTGRKGKLHGILSPITPSPVLYAPSIVSSNSSNSSNSSSNPTSSTLTSARSQAFVRTWKSHQTNAHTADVFSLAAVILDILTHLCKRKISAFVHHRGAKNRKAGRGGGVADASFHLDRNAGQITSWITLLDADARKRKDPVFQAVGMMLVVIRGMLEREPERRLTAMEVEKRFAEAVRSIPVQEVESGSGSVSEVLHCVLALPERGLHKHSRRKEKDEEKDNGAGIGTAKSEPGRARRHERSDTITPTTVLTPPPPPPSPQEKEKEKEYPNNDTVPELETLQTQFISDSESDSEREGFLPQQSYHDTYNHQYQYPLTPAKAFFDFNFDFTRSKDDNYSDTDNSTDDDLVDWDELEGLDVDDDIDREISLKNDLHKKVGTGTPTPPASELNWRDPDLITGKEIGIEVARSDSRSRPKSRSGHGHNHGHRNRTGYGSFKDPMMQYGIAVGKK